MKDKKPKPKRWRQDRRFVSWMLGVEYAARDPKLRALVSEGQAVYLWEAWCAGRESMAWGYIRAEGDTNRPWEAGGGCLE